VSVLLGSVFGSTGWSIGRNVALFLLVALWLATAYWTFKDARRRIEERWLVGAATLLGFVPPFLGPFIYLFFRPPEYLRDVRERELEIKAMEERLWQLDVRCPVCRARVEPTFLVCPVCTTRLKRACAACGQPLEALWQICPYCATPVAAAPPGREDMSTPPRRDPRRATASD
jgi:hypothetical protein